MADIVVDCSALSAVTFIEDDGETIRSRLRGNLHAPRLMEYEMANTAWKKARREPEQSEQILAQWATWPSLGITLHDPDQGDVLRLALEEELTAYDAAYLWLAESLNCSLVTLDRKLEEAVRSRRR